MANQSTRQNFVKPVAPKFTKWRNPLPHPQCVDVSEIEGAPKTRYELAPGAELDIPSRWDEVIHTYAGDPATRGPIETRTIIGGRAPQLIRVDLENAGKHPKLAAYLQTHPPSAPTQQSQKRA